MRVMMSAKHTGNLGGSRITGASPMLLPEGGYLKVRKLPTGGWQTVLVVNGKEIPIKRKR